MKVNLPFLGKCEVAVRYEYNDQREPIGTLVELFQTEQGNTLIGHGEAWCHHNDSPCKLKGRRVALKNMVMDARERGWELTKNDGAVLAELLLSKAFSEMKKKSIAKQVVNLKQEDETLAKIVVMIRERNK